MSDSMPSRPSADRNLLFGILALQMDFISRDALIAAMHAWVLSKDRLLGHILVEQQALQPLNRELLDALVARHLEMHGDDVEKSLAAMSVTVPLRQELHSLADGEVQASIAFMSGDEPRTTAYEAPVEGAGPRYHILRPHARGGLGEVFVALDTELQREVALKEIDQKHANEPHSRGRFVQEAEITGKLEHPGIVPVYGLGRYADGRPYYAMRFIQGETLKEAIARYHRAKGGRQPAGETPDRPADASRSPEFELRALLTRFVAVCNAMGYAHSRGVIHRDIKPSNIMLGKYGETLIVDWGLAKAIGGTKARDAGEAPAEPALVPVLSDDLAATHMGAALGTPAYMSAEQAAGRLDQLGPASDIYSLGATLYTLLTGRPPVDSKDLADTLTRVQKAEWPPPRQVKPDVPPALDAICRKAMALRPEQRYTTALALAADVEHWLADEPVAAWPEPRTVRLRRWCRRHRTLMASTLVALVVAVGASAVGLVMLAQANEREREAREEEAAVRVAAQEKEKEAEAARNSESTARRIADDRRRQAQAERDEAIRQRHRADLNLYVGRMNLIQREYEANNIPRVLELLDDQTKAEARWAFYRPVLDSPGAAGLTLPLTLRGFEWHYWHRMTHWQFPLVLAGHTGSVRSVAFSPDGTRLVTGSADHTVRLWDAATGRCLLSRGEHSDSVNSVVFSPDGKCFASASSDKTVRLWDTDTGQELFTLQDHKGSVNCIAFSPNGERLASASDDKSVIIWDSKTGRKYSTVPSLEGAVNCVTFAPDGKQLALGSSSGDVIVWDIATGRELLHGSGHALRVKSVVFSSDGKRLASGSADRTVRVWHSATLRTIQVLKGHADAVVCLAFDPDGIRLASGSLDQTVKVWDSTSGRELLTIKGDKGQVHSLAFSPDGKRLASAGADQTVRVSDGATPQELLTIRGHLDGVFAVALSPDGKRIVSGDWDGFVRWWDAETGQQLFARKGHESAIRAVVFSADGKTLVSGAGDNKIKIWDSSTGREIGTLRGHTRGIRCVALSPDGRLVASGGWDQTVKAWDIATGRVIWTFSEHSDLITSVVFSPDGKRLASASVDRTINVLESTTGSKLLTLKDHEARVRSVAFSPDGQRLASAGDDWAVNVWESATGQKVLTCKGHTDWIQKVVFSPDGSRLASASDDGTVRLWESTTGQELLVLKGHAQEVTDCVFSRDGKRLVSAGADMTIKIWEALPVSYAIWRKREIVGRVHSLFNELPLRDQVLARLRRDTDLAPSDRDFALVVANTHSEDPQALNQAAWKVVRAGGNAPEAYAMALRQAEAAVRMASHEVDNRNTLGAAQYRMREYAKALDTLANSDKLRTAANRDSGPACLAFWAMAHHRLSRQEQSKAILGRLRAVMKQPRWVNDAEAQDLLREAEKLIEDRPESQEGKGTS